MPKYPTLAVGLEGIVKEMTAVANWPLMFSTMIITIVPVLAVFIAFQKTIMDNMTTGGLKG